MSNTLEAIRLLEEKLQNLLSNYDFLKKENDLLLKNTTQLQFKLLEKEQQLARKIEEYELLKTAKTIQGSSKETKLKINAFIREIDRCIIQLQE